MTNREQAIMSRLIIEAQESNQNQKHAAAIIQGGKILAILM